jgi:mRNA-degrading endonuclease RelE of RelBE toxin-antitoxin system
MGVVVSCAEGSAFIKTQWQPRMRPTALQDLAYLTPKEQRQIEARIERLVCDPIPDGKTKCSIKHANSKVYRCRCGVFRIIYSLVHDIVVVHFIRRRNEETYKELDNDIDISDNRTSG